MEYLTNDDMGKPVVFIDNSGFIRQGTIKTFPFKNTVDIESNGKTCEGISAENIRE